MIDSWLTALRDRGAHIDDGVVTEFAGESDGADGPRVADLSHLGLIGVSGEDGEKFLQGQLSNDVVDLSGRARYAAYCTPKGRMLAFLLLWRDHDGFLMQLPAGIAEAIRKRLSIYVLRAKAKLRDAREECVRIGVAGAGSAALVERALGTAPPDPMSVAADGSRRAIGLAPDRFLLVVPPADAPKVWDTLAADARPVGAAGWEAVEVRAGIPDVVAATQEAFVPQMANLDLLGAISFTKGCYPGQEIVARTRYLGTVKRRMVRAAVRRDTAPQPGDDVYSSTLPGQSVGTVVRSARAARGIFDLLAVVQLEAAQGATLTLGAPDGPALELEPLPYPI